MTAETADPRTRTVRLHSIALARPAPDELAESVILLNDSLGEDFIQASDLAAFTAEHGGVLIQARGRLLGAATARVLGQTAVNELQDRLARFGIDLRLGGHMVGERKSAAVTPHARGLGLGTDMIRARLMFLSEQACTFVVCTSWVSGDAGSSSRGLLESEGFRHLATIPGYWSEVQSEAGYLCPSCGSGCVCAAVVMICRLENLAAAKGF